MKINKNVLLSLGSFIAAPVWYALWLFLGKILIINPAQSSVPRWISSLILWPYFIFFAIGIFFGWKNLKSEKPSVLGNIVTLLGILALFVSIYILGWAAAWSA